MKDPEKELIEEIVSLFEDYEESYVPGEWEAFAQQQQAKKPVPLRYWIRIAAVLIMVLSVLPFDVNDLFQISLPVRDTTLQLSPVPLKGAGAALSGNQDIPDRFNQHKSYSVSLRPANIIAVVDTTRVIKAGGLKLAADSALVQQTREYAQALPQNAAGVAADSAHLQKKRSLTTADFLAGESGNNLASAKKNRQDSRWDFGLAVIPSATGSSMDVGAGLTTAYQLTDKLALSSGVSLLQLQSAKNAPAGADNVSLMSISDKSLLAVNTNIKAIDIPIGIVYQVNRHFYTSAGVSFLNIISDKQSSVFSQTSQVSMMATSPSGAAFSYKVVQTSQVNELTPESTLRGTSYLGFFNFSVGRKQNIFGNYKIQVEPFIKVPIGKLSAEDLRLTNSGVKFQFSF